MFFITTRAAVA